MTYYSKDQISALVNGSEELTSVKYRHPGPRGRQCLGNEIRLSVKQLKNIKEKKPVDVFCPGCGWNGWEIISR